MSDTHAKTALLVMDMQEGIVSRYVQAGDLLTPVSTAIAAARAASIPVIYVVVTFRPGYPEISPNNRTFAAVKHRQASMVAPIERSPRPGSEMARCAQL